MARRGHCECDTLTFTWQCWVAAAEPGAAPDRGRIAGFARHQALAAPRQVSLVVRQRASVTSTEALNCTRNRSTLVILGPDKGSGVVIGIPTTYAPPAECLGQDWPSCQQVFRLEHELHSGERVETEVVFGITSPRRERAGAAELFELTREQRRIENGLQGRRDVTRREDACRVRKAAAPQALAWLRNPVIDVFPYSGRSGPGCSDSPRHVPPREGD
jgi:hypothetical protein